MQNCFSYTKKLNNNVEQYKYVAAFFVHWTPFPFFATVILIDVRESAFMEKLLGCLA